MDKQAALDEFLTGLITEKFGNLEPARVAEFRDQLFPRLYKWILLKTMTRLAELSGDLVTEFENLITKKLADPADVIAFVESKIPSADAFLAETLLGFRGAYLGK